MAIRTIEAWVLHKYWSGDSSVRVIFLTRELGLIHCFYKGGRIPKKQAFIQPFTSLWVSFIERYDRFYLHSLESSTPSLQLTGHSLFSGLYLNEILYYVLKPNASDSILFDAYLFTLNSLVDVTDRLVVEALLRRFEWTLLRTCGYSFSLTQEARTKQPIVANLSYQFVVSEGFVPSSHGIPGAHILALAKDDLSEVAVLKSAKIMMRQAIDDLIGGREIKSRSLYFDLPKT